MSIRVQHVSKVYGQQKAVNQISFAVDPGEIVGFLGPNGAGKSTTLKMITGYLPPTAGSIFVNSLSVQEEPREVRRQIGYLPEHNPLYLDLYVHEYLRFAGGFYGLQGSRLTERVKQMIHDCGLTREQNKKIEALSKGYRQRVGLAQALMHDPPVLILDEPTTGLDPNQIVEIRELIRAVSRNKTVIFSSHIMQEVQALCQRVLIIHQGELVADRTLQSLLAGDAYQWVSIAFQEPVDAALLEALPTVMEVRATSDRSFSVRAEKHHDLRSTLFHFAASHQLSLVSLQQAENNLESVFRLLTQTGRA
jgi:ABC-2 type transport system ATP-binding protein